MTRMEKPVHPLVPLLRATELPCSVVARGNVRKRGACTRVYVVFADQSGGTVPAEVCWIDEGCVELVSLDSPLPLPAIPAYPPITIGGGVHACALGMVPCVCRTCAAVTTRLHWSALYLTVVALRGLTEDEARSLQALWAQAVVGVPENYCPHTLALLNNTVQQ